MPSVVRWDHFFGRFPQQIARSQRKTSKAALAVSCKRTHCCGRNFQPPARVIDDMVLVLRLKSDHKKFSDIGESLSIFQFGIINIMVFHCMFLGKTEAIIITSKQGTRIFFPLQSYSKKALRKNVPESARKYKRNGFRPPGHPIIGLKSS